MPCAARSRRPTSPASVPSRYTSRRASARPGGARPTVGLRRRRFAVPHLERRPVAASNRGRLRVYIERSSGINSEHEEKIRRTLTSEPDSNLVGPAEANGLRINQSDFRCVLKPHPERLIQRGFFIG